jgi:signal transduction histidine kinase
VLNLESPAIGAFSEQDSRLLQALATQAVIAIQEVRLLDALQEIAERLLTQPPQQVFERLVAMACELLDVPVGSIWVQEQDSLALRASNSAARRGERLPLHGSLTGQAILRRSLVSSDDLAAEPQFMQRELAARLGWAGALIAPLQAGDQDRPLGAFSVYSRAGDAPPLRGSGLGQEGAGRAGAITPRWRCRRPRAATTLRAAEEQRAVAETFAAVGDIAANLLHRVNNQVGAIPVRVEGIQDKCAAALAADPYLAHNLAEIERSAAEAMAVMRDTLFHLRPIRLAPVSLAECVAEALQTCALPPSIQVVCVGLEELPPVVAGPRRLSLVFVNLLENAATALEGAGSISLRGAASEGLGRGAGERYRPRHRAGAARADLRLQLFGPPGASGQAGLWPVVGEDADGPLRRRGGGGERRLARRHLHAAAACGGAGGSGGTGRGWEEVGGLW